MSSAIDLLLKLTPKEVKKLVISGMIDFINVSKPDLILETFDKKNEITAVESILPANIESGNFNNFIWYRSVNSLFHTIITSIF